MQTAATGYDLVLDPAAYAGIHLVESDGIPMESFWHFWGLTLLIDVTAYFCRHRTDYWVGGNNFIYFNPDQARNRDYRGPDYFFIKNGVDRAQPRVLGGVAGTGTAAGRDYRAIVANDRTGRSHDEIHHLRTDAARAGVFPVRS